MGRCSRCGAEIDGAARFCGQCGASLHVEPPTSPVADVHAATPSQAPTVLRPHDSPSSRPADARFLPGAVLAGRYRIVAPLGRGGFGEVYRADDLKLGQTVALKFLTEASDREERMERLASEVRLARRVAHPNVCRVYDLGEDGGLTFLAMEYVDGEDLGSLLRRVGRLTPAKAEEIAYQITAGLAAAHAEGVLHRDLKPGNIMIDGRGRARITDFGLAVAGTDTRGRVETAGTPAYMSPELLRGGRASVQSDLYALGLVLLALFTGRSAADLADRLPSEIGLPPDLSSELEAAGPALARTVAACLDPDPTRRPRGATEILAAFPSADPLDAVLARGETPSPELVAAAGRSEAMHPARVVLLLAATAALVGVSLWVGPRASLTPHLAGTPAPAAMVDRAQSLLRRLGYTDSLSMHPGEVAWGYRPDTELSEWEQGRPDSVRWREYGTVGFEPVLFWYRQDPRPFDLSRYLIPDLGPHHPYPRDPGEILVELNLQGRLRTLEVVPLASGSRGKTTASWGTLLTAAGIDSTLYRETAPLYRGFADPEERRAWLGPLGPGDTLAVRIEAGLTGNRPVLFSEFPPWRRDILLRTGRPPGTSAVDRIVEIAFLLSVVLAGVLARRNLRAGRADRRGAGRVAVVVLLFELGAWLLTYPDPLRLTVISLAPSLGLSLFVAALFWIIYVAMEPHARRLWPRILVSWSRLVSEPRVRFRDPVVGRAVLVGAAVGGATYLPLGRFLAETLTALARQPRDLTWFALGGDRYAFGYVFQLLGGSLFSASLLALSLVLLFLILRRKTLAIGAFVLIAMIMSALGADSHLSMALGAAVTALGAGLRLFVLIRYGLVGLASVLFVRGCLDLTSMVASWHEWTAHPGMVGLLGIAALAAYGAWAALRPGLRTAA